MLEGGAGQDAAGDAVEERAGLERQQPPAVEADGLVLRDPERGLNY